MTEGQFISVQFNFPLLGRLLFIFIIFCFLFFLYFVMGVYQHNEETTFLTYQLLEVRSGATAHLSCTPAGAEAMELWICCGAATKVLVKVSENFIIAPPSEKCRAACNQHGDGAERQGQMLRRNAPPVSAAIYAKMRSK